MAQLSYVCLAPFLQSLQKKLWYLISDLYFLIRGLGKKKGAPHFSSYQWKHFLSSLLPHVCHLSNQQPIAVLISLIIAHNNISTDFNFSTVLVIVQKLLSFILLTKFLLISPFLLDFSWPFNTVHHYLLLPQFHRLLLLFSHLQK